MNDREIEQLEDLLRRQPLRTASPRLDQRMQALWMRNQAAAPPLGRGRPWRASRRAVWSVAAAAGLALAVSLWLHVRPSGPGSAPVPAASLSQPMAQATTPRAATPPVHIERIWTRLAVGDEPVRVEQAPPERRIRPEQVRQVQWIDAPRGVRIQWTISSGAAGTKPVEYN